MKWPVRATVVIPAFNAREHLAVAIHSARNQTETSLEIIVVDDASTDDTCEVVLQAAAADPRIRLIRNRENQGPGASRNTAIDFSQGEWIVLLDADDSMDPQRVQKLIELAEQAGADLASDNLVRVEDKIEPNRSEIMFTTGKMCGTHRIDLAEFIGGNITAGRGPRVSYGFMHPILRRSFLRERGVRYDQRNRFGEDFLLYLECLLQDARWWVTPEAMYLYTVRSGSLTEQQSSEDLNRIRAVEARLLSDPRIVRDRAVLRVLRRHKRTIDRNYYYRAFTDAVKAKRLWDAWGVLLDSPVSAAHIARESVVQAPTILAKASRGGYRQRRAPASQRVK